MSTDQLPQFQNGAKHRQEERKPLDLSHTSAFQPFQRPRIRAPIGTSRLLPLQNLSNSSIFADQRVVRLNPYDQINKVGNLKQPYQSGKFIDTAFRTHWGIDQENPIDRQVAQMSKRLNQMNLKSDTQNNNRQQTHSNFEEAGSHFPEEEPSSIYQRHQVNDHYNRKLESSPHSIPQFMFQEPTAISSTRQDEYSEPCNKLMRFGSMRPNDIFELESAINRNSRQQPKESKYQVLDRFQDKTLQTQNQHVHQQTVTENTKEHLISAQTQSATAQPQQRLRKILKIFGVNNDSKAPQTNTDIESKRKLNADLNKHNQNNKKHIQQTENESTHYQARCNRDNTDAKQHRQGQKEALTQIKKFQEQREVQKQRGNERRTYGEFTDICQNKSDHNDQINFEEVARPRLRKRLDENQTQQIEKRIDAENEKPQCDKGSNDIDLKTTNGLHSTNAVKPETIKQPPHNHFQLKISHQESATELTRKAQSEIVPTQLNHQNSIQSNSTLQIKKSQAVRPYRHLNFVKNDRSKQIKMPVFRERDIFIEHLENGVESKGSINSSQRHNQQIKLFKDNLCEQFQDDDIDTDDEVLQSGIEQCHQDLRELNHQIKNNPRNFRADTNVVSVWKKNGFWFSQTASMNHCANNFGCKTIF